MGWTLTDSHADFATAALPFLRQRPAANTVPLTIVADLQHGGQPASAPPLFGWWEESGSIGGAFVHTPPHALVLAGAPERACEPLATLLRHRRRELSGVRGAPHEARRFAASWTEFTGTTSSVAMNQRLYRLGELAPLVPAPPGRARQAGAGDRDLLVDWFEAFAGDAGDSAHGVAEHVDDRLGHRGLTLWEVEGQPVALAGAKRPAAGVVRIGPVYTPAHWRRRGYGSAVTAAASRAALDAGALEIVLFTDLANATSNTIYRRIGFEPVEDGLHLAFHAPGRPGPGGVATPLGGERQRDARGRGAASGGEKREPG